MIFEEISKAFIDPVKNTFVGLPVANENLPYDSRDAEAHLEVFLLPAQPEQATLGATGCDFHSGIYQININYPINAGSAALYKKADEINAVFKSGATFSYGSTNVRIENVGISNLTVSDGYATLNLSIEYYAFSARV